MQAVKDAYLKTVFRARPGSPCRPRFVPQFEDIDLTINSGQVVLHDALNNRAFVAPKELTFRDIIGMQAEPNRRQQVQ